MNWFTKLTRNILIAPKITQIAVLYRPPYASLISSACRAIAEDYGMPRQTLRKIVSEYNDMCVDTSYATDADDQLQKMNAIESGELERVLGGGIQRLTSLCSVSLRSDLDLPTGSSHCLNMPQFLRQDPGNRDDGKFGLIQNLAVASMQVTRSFDACIRSSLVMDLLPTHWVHCNSGFLVSKGKSRICILLSRIWAALANLIGSKDRTIGQA